MGFWQSILMIIIGLASLALAYGAAEAERQLELRNRQ
jgi:hypothetical protein